MTVFVLTLLFDEYNHQNFMDHKLVSWIHDITLCFVLMILIFAWMIYWNQRFPSIIDIDILSVNIYWMILKIYRSAKSKQVENSY